MIEVLMTLVPSLCWLAMRCYQLLQTAPEKLARQLNVEIPPAPVVCIDELGRSHVTFHWDEPTQATENVFYAVMVNGTDVGTLARKSVKLCDLAPDTLYSIQVLAVNVITNFVSQSAAVYVHTEGAGAPLSRARAKNIDLPSVPAAAELKKHVPDAKSILSSEISPADVAQITAEPILTAYLCILQEELSKTTRDHEKLSLAQAEEENRLRAQIESYKKELGEGSNFRAKKDHDLKDLERQKDSLAFEKLKLVKQLKNHALQKNMQQSKLADLRTRISKLTERKNHMLHAEKAEQDRRAHSVDALSAEISASKNAAAQIDESNRALAVEKRNLAYVAAQLRPVVQQLVAVPTSAASSDDLASPGPNSNPSSSSDVFTREGSLTKTGAHYMQDVYNLRPEWQVDLARELEHVTRTEASWRDAFRAAIARYLSLFHSLEAARFYADESYEQQRLTEHQASVLFGGYGLALPKPAHKKTPQLVVSDVESGPASGPSSGPTSPPPPPPPPDLAQKDPYPLSLDPRNNYTVSTPQSASASMAFSGNMATNMGVSEYAGSTYHLSSPNTSFGEHDLPQYQQQNSQIDPASASASASAAASGWLHHQTYPALGQAQYSNFAFDSSLYSNAGNTAYPPTSAPQVSIPHVHSNLGSSIGRSVSPGIPSTMGSNLSQNISQNLSQSLSQNLSQNISQNMGHSLSQNMSQNIARPLSPSYLGDFQDQQRFTPELSHAVPASSMGQYAPSLRPNYAYTDSLYQSSPVPETAYLNPQIPATSSGLANTLWNNSSQGSFVENRRTFPEYSLQSQVGGEPLNPSVSHNSNLSTDSALLNSFILPTASHFSTTNSIWSDRYLGGTQGHNRTVSSGSHLSHLWRNEATRQDKSPNNGFVSEFLPFSQNRLPSQHGNPEPGDGRDRAHETDFDIRSL